MDSERCLIPLRKGVTADSVPSKLLTITAAGRSLVASVDKNSDISRFVEKAGCGLWVEPESPDALAEAIFTLYHDPNR